MSSVVLLTAFLSAAQIPPPAAAVSGRVFDSTASAVVGARVRVVCDGLTRETRTDADGRYQLPGLPSAVPCEVVASAPGFLSARRRIDTAKSGAAIDVQLSLQPYTSEIVVTPARGRAEDTARVAQMATVVDRSSLHQRPFTVVTQALREEVGVLAQQTTSAQGSPILRGFTGQRNGYLLDGIRFNTAAWRDGPSQYLAWIPGAHLDRIEVVRGPGSAQYGSDALGGTISLFSRPAAFTREPSVSGQASVTLAAANALRAADVGLSMARAGVAGNVSASVLDAGDLRPGRGIDSHAAVTRYLGISSAAVGERLEHTGFRQSSASGALAWQAGAGLVTASFLHAQQVGARRYDQEIGGNGRYRSEFGPQRLDFGFLRYSRPRMGGLEDVSATLSINRQDDGRLEQLRPGLRVDEQSNTTTAIGYQAQARRSVGARAVSTFGVELFDEFIAGERLLAEPDGRRVPARPDIPDGTRYRTAAIYWQQGVDVAPGRLSVSGGLRAGRHSLEMRANPAFGVTGDTVTTGDVSFNAGAVVALTPSLNATVSIGRGFRAANAFDFGSIGFNGGAGFEIAPGRAAELGAQRGTTDGATAVGTGQPIEHLRPEELYAYEAGLRWRSGALSGSVTAFHLDFHDAIERRTLIFPAGIVGTDIAGYAVVRQDEAGRAYVAGEARPIVTRVNVSRSRIRGVEADATARLSAAWRARAWASMANGREIESGAFRRRMPPAMGGAALTWQRPASRAWVEGVLLFARAQTRLSDGDLGDARIGARRNAAAIAAFFNGTATDRGLVSNGVLRATGETLAQVTARVLPAGGNVELFDRTPGFAVVGLRAGIPLARRVDLVLLGENLTDRNYRLHGSGLDEPGLNIQARLTVRF
ncbi:MAG: TonB-dependent receptor [Acidobacteriota bacterium]